VVSSFHTGYIPPKVLNYVVAYDGPAQMQTVYGWLNEIHETLAIANPMLSQNANERLAQASTSIDGVFVLDKGFIYFDNTRTGFANAETRAEHPNLKWVFGNTNTGNLLLFFTFLHGATANIEGRWLNPIPYLASFNVPNLQFGT
jgi:hypothetical protein